MCETVPSKAAIDRIPARKPHMILRTRCDLVFFNVRIGLTAFACAVRGFVGVPDRAIHPPTWALRSISQYINHQISHQNRVHDERHRQ